VRILAHWTFIQSQIHIALANKRAVLKQEKHFLTGTTGDIIRTARQQIGLMQEKLAELTGIHRQRPGPLGTGPRFLRHQTGSR
jgi:hypothetical protein